MFHPAAERDPQRVNGGVSLPISLLALKPDAIRVHQSLRVYVPGSQLLTHFPAFAGTFGFSVCAPCLGAAFGLRAHAIDHHNAGAYQH